MTLKKTFIIIFAVMFFLTALTLYVNRVIFPQLIKKIAVKRIEETIHRKVEIGSIRFSWIRGFIIDKIKVYEKDPHDGVFAQAQQVSFGILLFPGPQHYRITIPYINILSPSVHLVRISEDTWNFSDMIPSSPDTTPVATTGTIPSQAPKSPAFEMAWGGISINDGKFLVNDLSQPRRWSEYFDNINLKLSLSYKGISYDFTADIPGKNGFIGASVYYQPLTKNTKAQIHLKNIDTASYLSLVNIPDIHLDSGIIKQIDLDINYTQSRISAQGDVIMKNLDISSNDQHFNGDVELHDMDALYQNGAITARGQMALSNIETKVPGLSAGGSVESRVNEFELTKQGLSFNGSLHAQQIFVNLKDRRVKADRVILDNIKIKKDINGIQSVGSIATKGLDVQWPDQRLQGDISLNGMTMRMKYENNIFLQGTLEANNLSTKFEGKNFFSRHLLLENIQLNILDQKNIALNTKLSVDGMKLNFGNRSFTSDTVKTDRLIFNSTEDSINVSALLNMTKTRITLRDHQYIEADPRLELALQIPLSDPSQMTYKGSITLSDGLMRGFSPIQSLDNIELDADFQNDEVTINALSINVLDTNFRINGTIDDFKHPRLNIIAEADEMNLAKIRDIAPRFVDQYGLSFDGNSYVKIKFDGLLSDPLAGSILAVASFKNVSVYSSKLRQRIKNITGIIEATPNYLKWRDTTATFRGQEYTLLGSLRNFKNPKVQFSVIGANLILNADLAQNNDLIIINSFTGKFLNADFDSKGTIALTKSNGPMFDIDTNVSFLLKDLIKILPSQQMKNLQLLEPTGLISIGTNLKGTALDWKNYRLNGSITSPRITLKGYSLTDMRINFNQDEGNIKHLTFDGKLYDGTVHGVGTINLSQKGMPYNLALNIANSDLHKLKLDSPLKMEEIDGKFFLTALVHGKIDDFKNNVHATGSLAIRDGYLAEFNLFKGMLSLLNDILHLGQIEITDVDGNFTIENQRINTDNLRLKGPTIVLLNKGWVNFDQMCAIDTTIDLSSGVVPEIAHDVLSTLQIHTYDKISDPKYKKKISVPQVINSLIKNFLE